MRFYSKHILPRAVDFACKLSPNQKQRKKIIPLAEGDVLEIGIGSGLNLPFYDSGKVRSVVGIDPSAETWAQRDVEAIANVAFGLEFVCGTAEKLPFDDRSFTTAVVTYSLCSIDQLEPVFDELRRVLNPNGELLFCEHGKAPDERVYKWQKRIDPIWGMFSGGCSLSKDIPKLITENGFNIGTMEMMYIPGWKPGSFNYWGRAVPR